MAEEKLRVTILVDRKDFERGLKDASKSTEKFQKTVNGASSGLGRFFAAAGGMTAIFNTLRAGFKATGEGADTLTRITDGLRAGIGELGRAIIELDFKNFAEGLVNSVTAATDLAVALDQVNQRMRDLQVIKSAMHSRVSTLRLKRAEGTISGTETAELENISKQLLGIETDIYAEGIKSMQDYIASRTGLNAILFDRLQQGVEERAKLSKAELDNISSIGDKFQQVSDDLKKQFPDSKMWITGANGMPMRIKTASDQYTAAINQWVASLTAAELAQLTEDRLIGNEEEWKRYIDLLTKRNDLTGEYALEMAKVARAQNTIKTEREYASGVPGKAAPLPYLGMDLEKMSSGQGSVTDVFEGAKAFVNGDPYLEALNAQLSDQMLLANELTGVFTNMFSVMDEGWASMADALIESLKRIAQEIIAKAAVWAIMAILFPGSSIAKAGIGGILGLSGGGGGASNWLSGNVGGSSDGMQLEIVGKTSGTDIAWSSARGNKSLRHGT